MSVSSKTGLIPIQNRNLKFLSTNKTKEVNKLISSTNVSKPVVFSIRPFGELYNPYSKCCSVLCNHPAPPAVRNVIKQAKDSWSVDARNQNILENDGFISNKLDAADHIPEELFRRYTDTDSRPLTPTPTTTSIRTRNSGGSFLMSRRCVTPEPGKENMNKRKKIILDLRRSHSQETVYWKAPSDTSHGITTDTISHLASNEDNESNREKKLLSQAKKKHCEDQVVEDEKSVVCVNERGIQEEEPAQRRGKKRKKSKQQQATTTFHLSQDPETQVSALGPDSLNASTRPSLIPNLSAPLLVSDSKSESIPTLLKDSYLTSEAFRVLKTDLDIDILENTFERYLNRAFLETMKYLPPKPGKSSTSLTLPKNIQQTMTSRKSMPRKLSKSAARFEMPLDLQILKDMSPYCYLSQYVRVSRQRKQLYKKTFTQHLCKEEITDGNEQVNLLSERKMEVSNFDKAMKDVLGLYGTEEIINRVRQAVDIDKYSEINFRSWCGLVSFAERVVISDFANSDSCDELEKSDFESLEQRMISLDINDELLSLFELIRQGHFRKTKFDIPK